MNPLNPIGCYFEKNTVPKNMSYKEKDLTNEVKCCTENNNAKFEVIENFYSDLPKVNTGWKSNN